MTSGSSAGRGSPGASTTSAPPSTSRVGWGTAKRSPTTRRATQALSSSRTSSTCATLLYRVLGCRCRTANVAVVGRGLRERHRDPDSLANALGNRAVVLEDGLATFEAGPLAGRDCRAQFHFDAGDSKATGVVAGNAGYDGGGQRFDVDMGPDQAIH